MLPFWVNSSGKREGWQRGWHGYDNELMDMRGIFLAFGPGRQHSKEAALIGTNHTHTELEPFLYGPSL